MKHKPDFIDREIGRRLRVARISANIRQYRAAKAVGVTYQQMRKYEVGYNRVSAVIVARLAQIYRRPVEWFLEEVRVVEDAKAVPLTDPMAQADCLTRANGTSDRPEQTGH
jgi:transcriptional regulator with XRE-family HTH domain